MIFMVCEYHYLQSYVYSMRHIEGYLNVFLYMDIASRYFSGIYSV